MLIFLEARNVSGAVKPVLEFVRQAARPSASPQIDPVFLTFVRGERENDFTRAVCEARCPLELVTERGTFDFGILSQLREIVGRLRPDVIWTNSVKSHFLVRLAKLHQQAGWVAYHHGYTTTALRTRLYNQLDRWSHRAAVRVVTVCRSFAEQLVSHGVDPCRIQVQHCPIGPPQPSGLEQTAELKSRLGIGSGERILLSVGRLSREKGHAELIRAAARIRDSAGAPRFRVLVAGEGPELARLRTLAASLHLSEAVLFLGHQSDVNPLYAVADVLVLSSHTEGSPNVLLEAMQAGVPVVATRVGGVPEIITDEVSGLLVADGNVAALAGGIRRVLENEQLRAQLVSAARGALDRHSPELYFRNIATLLEEVAGPPAMANRPARDHNSVRSTQQ